MVPGDGVHAGRTRTLRYRRVGVKGLVELVEGEAKKMPTPGLVVRLEGRDEKRRKRIVDNEGLVEGEHWHEQYQRRV